MYWSTGTARLLPRLINGRPRSPLFLSERRPVPGDLYQRRHPAATTLGEKGTPLQRIMAKTRHRNPRTAMRYVRPGGQAVAEFTDLLDTAPPRR